MTAAANGRANPLAVDGWKKGSIRSLGHARSTRGCVGVRQAAKPLASSKWSNSISSGSNCGSPSRLPHRRKLSPKNLQEEKFPLITPGTPASKTRNQLILWPNIPEKRQKQASYSSQTLSSFIRHARRNMLTAVPPIMAKITRDELG